MKCRHCNEKLEFQFLDLGNTPPSNAYLKKIDLKKPEITYPLRVMVCNKCWLVQTQDYTNAEELFKEDYAYFSSTSKGWLNHAKHYSDMIIKKLGLNKDSFVVELASNDGYLLKNFVENDIPCLGIEPTKKTAEVARNLGIPVDEVFFNNEVANKMSIANQKADLVIGNNVYAHVPDINDFTKGIATILKTNGIVTLEFPHLLKLIKYNQFDTIYHEHFSYLSLHTVNRIFSKFGLKVFDVEEIDTHGGSLRVYGCLKDSKRAVCDNVKSKLELESKAGLQNLNTYEGFQMKVNEIKNSFIQFLISAKNDNKTVAGYGAAAKGNTLINYSGIRPDLMPFVCDAANSKINKYLPASHIPILSPTVLKSKKIDYLVIFPWNIVNEIMEENQDLIRRGTKFVTMIPELNIQ